MDQKDKSQLSFYNNIAELLATANDAHSISKALYSIIDGYIEVPHSALFLWEPKEAKLKLFGSNGFTKKELVEVENTALDRHPGWVFKNKKSLHIPDMDKEDVPSFVTSSKRSFKVKSRLWVPITTADGALGAFGFASQEKNYFTDDHVNVLNFACRLAGNIYSNIIFSQSEKDYLNNIMISYKKIKEASKTQQNFIAKMSHEIRTPLNGIIGMSKLIEGTLLNQTQKKYVEIINSQSMQLIGLINDVLDISKVQSQNFKLVSFPFNFNELLVSNIKPYKIEASLKGIDFDYSFDSLIQNNLKGDSLRISQILNNLLSNALKFTKKGFIKVSVSNIKQTKNFQHIKIVVEDSGIGIEDSKLEKIFEGFHQEDDSIVRDFGGTGLGLMITKEIVNQMNGQITVESKKGVGSKFELTLKIAKSSIEINNIIVNDNFSIQGLRILVAEDNEVNSFYLKTILEQEGVLVKMAINGKEVVEYCRKDSFDLILMDIQMPILDGIAAAKIIREELNIEIPIIAQTANTVQKDIDACYEAGIADYISKPFMRNELVKKIAINLNIGGDSKMSLNKKIGHDPFTSSVLNVVNGNAEFANKIIEIFKNDTPKNLKYLKTAISNKQENEVNKIGHKIKSSFRMFKLKHPFELCLWIEQFSSKSNSWKELHDQVSLLEIECAKYIGESH
jgi:signal transduction histidine kinase/DNA-binding NarL/FixJ family response regulator